jgi:hypothetical protein
MYKHHFSGGKKKKNQKGHAAADASSYITVLLKFEFTVVHAVMLQYTLGYTIPLSILIQSESCDLMKVHQEARVLVFNFSGHI